MGVIFCLVPDLFLLNPPPLQENLWVQVKKGDFFVLSHLIELRVGKRDIELGENSSVLSLGRFQGLRNLLNFSVTPVRPLRTGRNYSFSITRVLSKKEVLLTQSDKNVPILLYGL